MDPTNEDYTERYTKYRQRTSYTNMTKEKFKEECKKLFDKDTNLKGFYLEDFYDNGENHIRYSNLVILACKYNKIEILKYLFSNSGILNSLTPDIGRTAIEFNDQDDACHNALYYSVRSNNVELVDTLINEWLGDYFVTSEQLSEVLSNAYEELKLKNVSLSDEIQIYIESKLISLRFFSNKVKEIKNESLNNSFYNVKQRIKLVLQNINLLKTEYPITKKVDDKFLFVIKFIAQNIHILKRQLKSTYVKIPWEEIEFCIVSFVSSHMKQQELNLFYRVVLNKSKVLNYLENFAQVLGNVKQPEMFTNLPKGKRQEIVAKIINNYPQFYKLYTDYQQIRDICSLQKMKDYVELAPSIDFEERQGQLIITRILQVVGEHLKNSLESPKLSDSTSQLLLLSLPEYTKKVVMDLRDSLSHAHSFAKIEIEKDIDVKFFKKFGVKVNATLHKQKMKVIKTLFAKIENCQCLDEIKEVTEVFVNTGNEFDVIEKELQTMECVELEILIKELNNSITEKTEDEQKLLDRIHYIINASKTYTKSEYLARFKMLRNLTQNFSNSKNDNNTVRNIKFFTKKFKNITVLTESYDLEEIVKLLQLIFYSIEFRFVNNDSNKIRRIIFKIFANIEFERTNIKWIEGLQTKLTEKASFISEDKQMEDWNIRKEMYNNELELKLSELEDVLTDNKLISNLIENLPFYKSNKRLQSVIEMLVLYIMSILDSSTDCLENNSFCLDDNSPSLIGKCLRNHLAHDNSLVNILSSDPLLNVILNAVKLVLENITENKRKLGKSTKDDYMKVRDKYCQNLAIVINQQGMYAALEEGNFENLKSFLRRGADKQARNTNLWTALHFAAKGPNLEIVKFLLSNGLDINVKNIDGQSPLHVAAANGRTNIVKYLVEEQGLDVNDTDNYEKTPLHIAVQSNHKDTVKVLLKNGSKVDMQDTASYTPLHYAVMNNCVELVKILMVQPTDVNDYTLLHLAVELGYSELVNLFLLENKANVSAGDKLNVTPLHLAALNGHQKVVCTLILEGANVNARDIHDCTPLHYAVNNGHEAVARVLIVCGADTNASDKVYNNTPLHYAAANGYKEIVLDLMKHKTNANVTTVTGITPLHLAAQRGHLEMVNILIDHGANVHAKDEENATALYHAAIGGHKEIVKLLLRSTANLNVRTVSGLTPLHAAVKTNRKEVAELLIENKAKVNSTDNAGRTPLHTAVASYCNKDVIELLTTNKAIINARDKNGVTPLHIAAYNGCIDNALLLIGNGANINTTITGNATVFHLAVQQGHKNLAALLLKYNPDENKRYFGCTPLDLAICSGHIDIVDILLAKGARIHHKNSDSTSLFTTVKYNQQEGYDETVDPLLINEANTKYNNRTLQHVASQEPNLEMASVVESLETLSIFSPLPNFNAPSLCVVNEIPIVSDNSEQFKNEMAAKQVTIMQLNTRANAMSQKIVGQNETIEQLLTENECHTDYEELKTENEELIKRNEKFDKESKQWEKKYFELEKEYRLLNKENQWLEKKNRTLKTENQKLHEKSERAEKKLDKKEKQLETLKERLLELCMKNVKSEKIACSPS